MLGGCLMSTSSLVAPRFLLRNLTRFYHEHLALILKLKKTSWLVMSGVRKYQTTLKLMSRVVLTIPIIVPYINFMHHTA
jgi:hypothetical protein